MMMNLPCLWGSCPNFLRPIYHTLSASQAPKRGHAPRKKTMPATALVLMFDCYWPAFTCRGTDLLSGRYTISGSCWPFADAVRSGLHHLWFSIPEPCPVSEATSENRIRFQTYNKWFDIWELFNLHGYKCVEQLLFGIAILTASVRVGFEIFIQKRVINEAQ